MKHEKSKLSDQLNKQKESVETKEKPKTTKNENVVSRTNNEMVDHKEDPYQGFFLKQSGDQEQSSDWTTFKMTHYTPYCPGCSGISAAGYDLRKGIYHNGMRMIAVDPSIIPLKSIVEINDNGNIYKALAVDTGGAIKGNKIDLLVQDRNTAYSLGVKTIKLRVVK